MKRVFHIATRNKCIAIRNKCIDSSNKCLTSSNKKLVGAPGLTTRNKNAFQSLGTEDKQVPAGSSIDSLPELLADQQGPQSKGVVTRSKGPDMEDQLLLGI